MIQYIVPSCILNFYTLVKKTQTAVCMTWTSVLPRYKYFSTAGAFALLCSSNRLSLFDQWFVKAKVQKQVVVFLALSKHKKGRIIPFHNAPGWYSQAKTKVQLWLSPKKWHFPWSFALNSPYHSHREQQFVCHEVWGISPIWAYFTDNTLISGKMSPWQMNLPAVQGARTLFSD